MRLSPAEFLIERLFSEFGAVWGQALSIEEAYVELKELAGEDFGIDNEPAWRAWLKDYKAEIARRVEEEMSRRKP